MLWYDNSNFASYLYFYSDVSRVQPSRSNRCYIGMSLRPVFNEDGAGVNDVMLDNQGEFSAKPPRTFAHEPKFFIILLNDFIVFIIEKQYGE